MDRHYLSIVFALLTLGIVKIDTAYGDCGEDLPKVFDYIVVGSGAAGATIAARLTKNPDITVLLLEAGTTDTGESESPLIETPRLWYKLIPGPVTWDYTTVPQTGLNGRVLFTGMGKTLGGSTSKNAMIYLRGFKSDYDTWAAKGAKGWSYYDVFPYFLKSENNISPLLDNSVLHNSCGPLTVSQNLEFLRTPLYKLFRDTAKEMKIPYVDCNGPSPFGLCHKQATIKAGKRQSTSVAFLRPAMGRKNLFVATESQVEKVLITRNVKRAYGVRFSYEGLVRSAKARKEVILSAGTFETPKLLQLSGIGPRKMLRKAKIRTLVDLPVGYNYHDHLALPYDVFLDIPTVTREVLLDPTTLSDYIYRRQGPTITFGAPLHNIWPYAGNTFVLNMFYDLIKQKRFNWPEMQIFFSDGRASEEVDLADFTSVMEREVSRSENRSNGTTAYFVLLHPKSRGMVQIRSRDPKDHPLIDARYLQKEHDVKVFISGIRKLKRLIRSQSMQDQNAVAVPSYGMPAECNSFDEDSSEQLECILRNQGTAIFHPVGSCKMGRRNDPTTVVDPELRVKGIKGLRVADASVMPEITSGNTMAPTIMIGEKAADMILKDC